MCNSNSNIVNMNGLNKNHPTCMHVTFINYASAELFAGEVQTMSLSAGRSSLLQNWLYSRVSPLSFFTSTTRNVGVMAKISAAMASFPLRPLSWPCSLTLDSLFVTLNLPSLAATSSSFDITLLAGLVVANLSSSFSSLFFSSNSGDKSNPSDKDMMWNAFRDSVSLPDFSQMVSSNSSWSSLLLVFMLLGTDFLNQELSMIFEIVIRVLGFGSRSFVTSLRASEENQGGHLKSPR
ncbi:hypothetical protein F2P56_013599 [Juglans regia]|uniref:Uncharacterized protein n=1 Tax=Juglans regia TaxID=51240 RepID=A0A834CYE2_JUGRE|nr:hypothetical protein F2P56_013599 [Juglans regia]